MFSGLFATLTPINLLAFMCVHTITGPSSSFSEPQYFTDKAALVIPDEYLKAQQLIGGFQAGDSGSHPISSFWGVGQGGAYHSTSHSHPIHKGDFLSQRVQLHFYSRQQLPVGLQTPSPKGGSAETTVGAAGHNQSERRMLWEMGVSSSFLRFLGVFTPNFG